MSVDESGISSVEADWSRERLIKCWEPAKKLLKSIRDYHTLNKYPSVIRQFMKVAVVLRYRFWSIVSASDIPINCTLGGGLILQHPVGIVIHPDAEVGVNCLILQQVTIVAGVKIGGHVDIGAGAKIVAPVTIGDHARIGANAVVINDVPAYATAVGVPAKVVKIRESHAN